MALENTEMPQIMGPENPPQKTRETALEVGGNPGPSWSLEIWGKQGSRGQDQSPEAGALWTRDEEERKDLILVGKQEFSRGLS